MDQITKADTCDVCRMPIKDIAQGVTQEDAERILMFCTQKCAQQYAVDPDLYADYDDDEFAE